MFFTTLHNNHLSTIISSTVDMSDDLRAQGAREVVADHLASDNHVNRKLNFVY